MRQLRAPRELWERTWNGLQVRSAGRVEAACVWLGHRSKTVEDALDVVFLDDLPGTVGRQLQHRTSRTAVALLLQRARDQGMCIVGDLHTHPRDWVDLSEVDRAHPIEYRVGLLAFVLPSFAKGAPDLNRTGVHTYLGDEYWHRLEGAELTPRFVVQEVP